MRSSIKSYKFIEYSINANLFFSGDHIICMDDMYGGTNRYFRKVASKFGLEISFVDETVPANVERAMKQNTKMVGTDNKCRI